VTILFSTAIIQGRRKNFKNKGPAAKWNIARKKSHPEASGYKI